MPEEVEQELFTERATVLTTRRPVCKCLSSGIHCPGDRLTNTGWSSRTEPRAGGSVAAEPKISAFLVLRGRLLVLSVGLKGLRFRVSGLLPAKPVRQEATHSVTDWCPVLAAHLCAGTLVSAEPTSEQQKGFTVQLHIHGVCVSSCRVLRRMEKVASLLERQISAVGGPQPAGAEAQEGGPSQQLLKSPSIGEHPHP